MALGAFAVLCAFAGGAGAKQPAPGTTAGKSHGLTYRTETVVFAGSDISEAGCPLQQRITGGGAGFDGSIEDAQIKDLGPDFLDNGTPPQRGFAVRGEVVGLGQDLTVTAICMKAKGLRQHAETASVDAPQGQPFTLSSKCPTKTSVTGGGFVSTASDDELQVTAPFDGHDSDKKPDDGWTVTTAAGALPNDLTVTAVCVKSKSVKLSYESAKKTRTGNLRQSALCPEKTAVTGGGVDFGTAPGAVVSSTAPIDFGDADDVPSDGWFASGHTDAAARDLRVYAICRR